MKQKIDNSNIKRIFGKNIKHARTNRHLSQEQLAEKISKSPHFVSLIERGKNSVSFSTIIDLCKALEVNVNDLFVDIIPSISNTAYSTNLLEQAKNTFDGKDKEMVEYLINYIIQSK